MRFVFGQWDKLCSEVLSNLNCILVREIPNQPANKAWVAVKHDVETSVDKALILAKIENAHGVCGTYFVQSYLLEQNLSLLQEIASLGHEVSYHYDVLDANNGNVDLALAEFTETVGRFENAGFKITSVCPHGNPLMVRSGWSSNKDFFRNRRVANHFPQIFDVVVQASEVLEQKPSYISDAGYAWKSITNVDSNDVINQPDSVIGSYDDLVSSITSNGNVIISSHPHRWEKSRAMALFNIFKFTLLRFVAKKLSKNLFMKRIMSKFYFLAKKI